MYEEKNVTSLRALCKERGMAKYSALRKAELVQALKEHDKLMPMPEAQHDKLMPMPEAHMPMVALSTMLTGGTDERAKARNKAKRRRQLIRAAGGQAG